MQFEQTTVDSVEAMAILLGSQPHWYQLSAGRFSAKLQRKVVSGVRFTKCRLNHSILMRTQTLPGYCTLLTQTGKSTFYNFGKMLRRDILISTGRMQHVVRMLEGCEVLIVEIPLEMVDRDLPRNGAMCASLERLELWNFLLELSGTLSERRKNVDLQQDLFVRLLAAVDHEPRLEELCSSLIERRAVIRGAQTYIEDRFPERVSVRDLCDYLQQPQRTLRFQFDEVYGMPPSRLSKLHRLHVARRQLEAASPGSIGVHDVATHCGFSHLSHFSHDFRSQFGILPSHSLSFSPPDYADIAKRFEECN